MVLVLLVAAIAGPVFSLLRNEYEPAVLLVVVEDSGSMAIRDQDDPDLGPGAEPGSRWNCALSRAATLDSAFARHDPPVEVVFLRGNGLAPLREFRLDDPVVTPPTGHGTDLAGLLRQAGDRMTGRPVRAMVLISDGQETRGPVTGGPGVDDPQVDGTSRQVMRTADLKVVGVGDPLGTADRVIKDLRYPDSAYEGDEVMVEFSVAHRFAAGSLGTSVQVRLRDGDKVIAETTVPVTGRVVPAALGFKPSGSGLKVYELEVSALDNERFLANNRASLVIDVRQERSRLLLLTGVPGWDVRFLAQAAAGEERIQLEVVYPSAGGLVFADSMVPWVAPTDQEGWAVWDGIIISDWTGTLAGQAWEGLEPAIAGGVGLLVVPGAGQAGSREPDAPPPGLAELLPLTVNGWRGTDGPFFAAVVPAHGGHPILEGLLDAGMGRVDGGSLGMPPLRSMVQAEIKPSATVLMTGSRREFDTDGDQPALLVVDEWRNGRIAWFSGRGLWDLAFWDIRSGATRSAEVATGMIQANDSPGRRLLRNILVWISAGEENSGLVFTGRQSVFQEGERIKLAAQWRDMRGRPVMDRRLSLLLRPEGAGVDSGLVRTFALTKRGGTSGLSEVVLPPLPPGRYTVQLVGMGDPPVTGKVERLVVSGYSIESTQVRLDRRRLIQVAARHQGEFYLAGSAEDGDKLVDGLLARNWNGVTVSRRNRLDFWSGLPFLGLITLLLGLEWFLRRRNGLL